MAQEEPNLDELKRLLRRLEKVESFAESDDFRKLDTESRRRSSAGPGGGALASLRTPLPPSDPSTPLFVLPDIRLSPEPHPPVPELSVAEIREVSIADLGHRVRSDALPSVPLFDPPPQRSYPSQPLAQTAAEVVTGLPAVDIDPSSPAMRFDAAADDPPTTISEAPEPLLRVEPALSAPLLPRAPEPRAMASVPVRGAGPGPVAIAAIFGALTGVVAAGAFGLGLIEIPMKLERVVSLPSPERPNLANVESPDKPQTVPVVDQPTPTPAPAPTDTADPVQSSETEPATREKPIPSPELVARDAARTTPRESEPTPPPSPVPTPPQTESRAVAAVDVVQPPAELAPAAPVEAAASTPMTPEVASVSSTQSAPELPVATKVEPPVTPSVEAEPASSPSTTVVAAAAPSVAPPADLAAPSLPIASLQTPASPVLETPAATPAAPAVEPEPEPKERASVDTAPDLKTVLADPVLPSPDVSAASTPTEAPPTPVIAPPPQSTEPRFAMSAPWTIPAGTRSPLTIAIEPAGIVRDHYVLIVGLEPEAFLTPGVEIIAGTWMVRGVELQNLEIERGPNAAESLPVRLELRSNDGVIVATTEKLLSTSPRVPAEQPASPGAVASSGAVKNPSASSENLSQTDAERLLRRGLLMLDSGNVSGARLLLQRAAELGSGEAALALARTFDPTTLPLLGAVGLAPDRALARRWYEHAVALGMVEGRNRLGVLDRN